MEKLEAANAPAITVSTLLGIGVGLETAEALGASLRGDQVMTFASASIIFIALWSIGRLFTRTKKVKFFSRQEVLRPKLVSLAAAALILGILVVTYLGSDQHIDASLADLSVFLGRGEDNSKWFAITSQLVSNQEVSIGAVGGVLVMVLALSVALVRILGYFLAWSPDSVGTVTSSVLVAYLIPIVSAPLAVISTDNDLPRVAKRFVALGCGASTLVLVGTFSRAFSIGHLSLIWAILLLTYCGLSLQSGKATSLIGVWKLFLVGASLSVWLGLRPLIAVVILLGLIFVFRGKHSLGKRLITIAPFGLLIVIVAETYQYTNNRTGYLKTLFEAGGGTLQTSTLMTVSALVVVLMSGYSPNDQSWRTNRSIPLVLIAYGLAVSVYGIWSTGQVNYGQTKAHLLISTVVLASQLPKVMGTLGSRLLSLGFVRVAVVVMGLIHADGLLGSSVVFARVETWGVSIQKGRTDWASNVIDRNGKPVKPEELALACAVVASDRSLVVSDTTYVCTRTLVGLSGLETESSALIEWQLLRDWFQSIDKLRSMNDEIQNRYILILDEGSNVMGKALIKDVVWRSDGLLPTSLVKSI
jgi:hypothetical protein